MQVRTYDAIRLGFVLDKNQQKLDPENYRDKTSFDVEVGEILTKDENDIIRSQQVVRGLESQDSAYLISEQYIRVPEGFVAYVFLKNRMSQRGLLALNTGIIDQMYYGPISTLIMNLSKSPAKIPKDDSQEELSFFRVVFHRIESTDAPFEEENLIYPDRAYTYQEYVNYRKTELAALPKTFLNVEAIENRISKKVTDITKEFSINRLLWGVAIIGLLLTIVPIGRDSIFAWQFDFKKYSEQSVENKHENKVLQLEIDQLKNDISQLKAQLATGNLKNNTKSNPMFTQNLNIAAPTSAAKEELEKQFVESLFIK
ncbi:hypothetical protein ACTNLV_001893 [Vibrio alginolyticus]